MVGIKVTWYWYEMKFYIHGLRIMGWYEFTGNMKEVDYEAGNKKEAAIRV